jgi:hypothetical protein
MNNIKRCAPYAAVAMLGVILLKMVGRQAPKMMGKMMGEGSPMGI